MNRYKSIKHLLYILLMLVLLFVGSLGVGIFIQQNSLIKAFDKFFYELVIFGPHPWWLNLIVKPFDKNFFKFGDMPNYYYPMLLGILVYTFFVNRKIFFWLLGSLILGTFLTGLVTTF